MVFEKGYILSTKYTFSLSHKLALIFRVQLNTALKYMEKGNMHSVPSEKLCLLSGGYYGSGLFFHNRSLAAAFYCFKKVFVCLWMLLLLLILITVQK